MASAFVQIDDGFRGDSVLPEACSWRHLPICSTRISGFCRAKSLLDFPWPEGNDEREAVKLILSRRPLSVPRLILCTSPHGPLPATAPVILPQESIFNLRVNTMEPLF
jgi:hypothetical protein